MWDVFFQEKKIDISNGNKSWADLTTLGKNQWTCVSKRLSLDYNDCMTPIKFVFYSFV